jgi:hypothetical protein
MGPLPQYGSTLKNLGITLATAQDPPQNCEPPPGQPDQGLVDESSACLLMALQRSRGSLKFGSDQLSSGTIVEGNYLTSTGFRKVKQLVDGWGQPLAFYRWPTKFADLNPNGAQPGAFDAMDRQGYLNSYAWLTNPNLLPTINNFKLYLHDLGTPTALNQPAPSYTLQPVVLSRGRDGKLGFLRPNGALVADPMSVSVQGQADDDLYSNRLRLGARGD